jgi:hypothetical protein
MFQYQTLTAVDAFRLVVLEAGTSEDVIRCHLVNSSLSENPDYEALSYTWGDTQPACEILLDGQIMSIRQNLCFALYHLRSEFEDRVLWIDAICIDQGSTSERNHQVRQMGGIYRHASTVLVWLGLPTENSRIAMEWIEDSSIPRQSPLGLKERLDSVSASQITRNQLERWQALHDFCAREYWHRVWIVQEVVLAQRIILHCGDDTARWAGLENLFRDYDLLYKPRAALKWARRFLKSLAIQLHHLRSMHRGYGCNLGQLMSLTKESRCSDARDKVYALLGLADDPNISSITVDYSESRESVYWSLWQFYVIDRPPSARIQGSQTLQRMIKSRKLEQDVVSHIRDEALLSLGRSVGFIRYVGQPWLNESDRQRLNTAVASLLANDFPFEKQWKAFMDTMQKTTAEDMKRAALSVRYESSPKASEISPREASMAEQATPTKGNHETIPENDLFSTLQLQELSFIPQDKYIFIGSKGQIGIVPHGVQPGDEICQFEESDITAIVRRLRQPQPHVTGKGRPKPLCMIPEDQIPVNRDLVAGALMARRWNEKTVCVSPGLAETFKFSVLDGNVVSDRERLSDKPWDDRVIQLSMTDVELRWLTG